MRSTTVLPTRLAGMKTIRLYRSASLAGLLVFAAISLRAHAGELAGSLVWSERVAMGTLVSGVVSKVWVRPGQEVVEGDHLVSLDTRGLDARVGGARAGVAHALALLQEAQREDERALELYDRTLLSDHERNQALIGLRAAEAELQRARAHLVSSQLDQERSHLRAPFAGRVLSVAASPGQAVVSRLRSQVLVELAADRQMAVQLQTDLGTAAEIEQAGGGTVEVAGRRLSARGVSVALEPDGQSPQGALYRVRVLFDRPEGLLLRAGQGAKLSW